ncbi:Wzz/FepE/Etk N-terminal domain-containing protein [Mycolicibacterium fallax]|uniref:Wzz/FepE/Etk N-terminal domain-containing protein n=1 Tax=Mycolicibacterium fallax TaxID=1793 RepID=UPI000A161769|nr:Wzz/FepE/Etk N-terminal domain-containing protein [Mycolicibacterium fallax]BBY99887.1 hypothetical protein MFAL_33540 [Mycolicibacterium fallax]
MELLKRERIALRRRWWVVAACLLVALVGVSGYNATVDQKYLASVELFLRAPDVKTSASAYQGDLFSRQRVLTYAKMFQSDDLAQRVIDRLQLSQTPQQLVSQVSASSVKDTVLMMISVADSSPERAMNIANAYGDVLASYVAKIEFVDNNPDFPPLVQVVTRANPASTVPAGLPLWQVGTLAALGALVVALALIHLLEQFDTRVRSRGAVQAIAGSPVVAEFARNKALARNADPDRVFDSDEGLRQAGLRLSVNVESALRGLADLSKPPVLAVVAPGRGDGASVVSRTLGRAFAERGRSVVELWVGPDGQEPTPRLAEVGSVAVMPVSPVALLTAESFDFRLDAAKDGADIVIGDCPAFSECVEAQVLIGAADAVVLVVAAGGTKRALTEIVAGTRLSGTPVLGVVVNFVRGSSTVDGRYL